MDRNNIKRRLFFWYAFLWLFLAFALYQSYGIYFLDLTSTKSKWIGLFAGAIGILFASLKICEISFNITQNTIYKQIANFFQRASFIFDSKINKFAIALNVITALILLKKLGIAFVICLITGAIVAIVLNAIIKFIFNYANSKANIISAESIDASYNINLFASIAISFTTISFCIIPIVSLYHAFKDYQVICGFLLGFGIFFLTSATSYIISKFALKIAKEPLKNSFQNLEKIDKRNPLMLLKGFLAGSYNAQYFCNNIFISYCLGFIGAITIGALCLNLMGAFLPIVILTNGLFASILCALFVKLKIGQNLSNAFCASIFAQFVIFSLLTYWTIKTWLLDEKGLIVSTILGALYALINFCINTKNSISSKSCKDIINASSLGEYSMWTQCAKASFKNIFTPLLLLILTLLFAFIAPKGIEAPLLGIFGMSLCVCGYLSTSATISISQIFGYNYKNTKEIPNNYTKEIGTQATEETKEITQEVENIFYANKNFNSIATFLSALSAFIAYTLVCYVEEMDILNPYILANLLLGAALGIIFASKIYFASSKNALKLVIEAKRQFRKHPQILEYQEMPNYEQPAKILISNNIIQISSMLIMLAIILYLDLHYLKYEAIAGLLFGLILSGFTISWYAINLKTISSKANNYFKNNYYNAEETKEYVLLSNMTNLCKIPADLIYGSYDILIKFIAITLLSLAIMFI